MTGVQYNRRVGDVLIVSGLRIPDLEDQTRQSEQQWSVMTRGLISCTARANIQTMRLERACYGDVAYNTRGSLRGNPFFWLTGNAKISSNWMWHRNNARHMNDMAFDVMKLYFLCDCYQQTPVFICTESYLLTITWDTNQHKSCSNSIWSVRVKMQFKQIQLSSWHLLPHDI